MPDATPTTEPAAAQPTTPAAPEAAKQTPAEKVLESFNALKARTDAQPTAKEPAAKEPAAPAAVDPDVAAVERILREDARSKAESKRIAADRAAFAAEKEAAKAELAAARAVKEARTKGDFVAALRAAGWTDAEIYEGDESALFKLAESKVAKPALDDKARIEAAIRAELESRAKAESESAAAKAKEAEAAAAKLKEESEAIVSSAREAFGTNVAKIAAAAPEKYRALAGLGITAGTVTEYAWQTLINSKGATVLSEEQALEDLEKHFAAKARAAAGIAETPPAEESKRPTSVNPGWQSDTPVVGGARVGLREQFEALKERARKASAT